MAEAGQRSLLLLVLAFVILMTGCEPTVRNRPPVAWFEIRWVDNLTVELDASLSYDADGRIESYEWDFGDGYRQATPFSTTRHRYQPGSYQILLMIRDNAGASAWLGRDIVIVPDKTLGFETIEQMRYGSPRWGWDPLELVIRTESQWGRLLKDLPRSTPEPPELDLTREMAVFVFLGGRYYANYAVQITKLTAEGGRLTVLYQEIEPGPNCLLLPAISYPFHLVRAERVDLPAIFVKQRVHDCP